MEAGVEGATVSIADDALRGMSVHVELPDAELESLAASMLGRFPFAFSIAVAQGSGSSGDGNGMS